MTTPALPQLLPVTPVGGASTPPPAPRPAPTPAAAQQVVSPFYLRYLDTQAKAIRTIARATGEDENAAVAQFIALEKKQPLTLLPEAETTDEEVAALNKPGYLAGLSAAMLHGATFGFGDEAAARLYGALTGVGARESFDAYKRSYEAWAKEHYGAALSGEIVGGLLPALLGAPPVAQEFSWLRATGIGLGYGALAGAGNAGGDTSSFWRFDDRLWGALTGAAIGTAGGTVMGLGGQYVAGPAVRALAGSRVGQKVAGAVEKVVKHFTDTELVSVTPEARARERVVRRLIDAGISYPEAEARINDMLRNGVVPTLAGIGGDPVASLVGEAAQQTSPRITRALAMLKQDMAEQPDVLKAAFLDRAVRPTRFGLAYVEDLQVLLEHEASIASKSFYEAAYNQVVKVTPRIRQRILGQPELYDAYQAHAAQAARDIAAGRGHGLPVPMLPGLAKEFPTELPIRGIDGMKHFLDAAVESKFAIPEGATPATIKKIAKLRRNYAATLNTFYDDVVQEATTQVSVYGKALLAYRGPSAARDAFLLGQDFWRKKPEVIARKLSTLDPNLQDFARIGYAKAAYEAMTTRGTSGINAAERFFGGREFGNSARAEQIRALFPGNPTGAEQFFRFAVGQARVTDATARVLQLSRNAGTQVAERTSEGSLPIRSQFGLTVASAVRNVAERTRTHLTQDEADELVYLGTKGLANPDELRAILRQLYYTYGGLVARPTLKRAATRLGAQQLGAAVTR